MLEAQLQNWQNFCKHHAIGDWYGTWCKYSSTGELTESYQGIRSLRTSEDGSLIFHKNDYIYPDGSTESKSFGPYQKPFTRSLFLDNSFSWGSNKIEPGTNFGFETGFRYEDRRISAAVVYNGEGNIDRIVAITEYLGSFTEKSPREDNNQFQKDWQGTSKSMTEDYMVSSPQAISWKGEENVAFEHLNLHLTDKVRLILPQTIENKTDFYMGVDWLVNPNLLYRGIRYFKKSKFTEFTLEELKF